MFMDTMAEPVPDPEMKEMCIMAYSKRTRSKRCDVSVPDRNDFIDVLWCIDDLPNLPEKWCPAEVLHVTASPEQDFLAVGVLLYLPGETWDEQLHKVEFLHNRKLRVAEEDGHLEAGANSDDIGTPSENKNTALDWRYSGAAKEDSHAEDEEWTPERQHNTSDTGKKITRRNPVSADQDEVKTIREGHASLIVEIQKLKREVATMWKHIAKTNSSPLRDTIHPEPGNVLPRLRHRLSLRMQAPLQTQRPNRKRTLDESEPTLTTGDGFHVGAVRARVECTLREFEELARNIRADASADSVFFFPPFSYTQQPIPSRSGFRILFSTFSKLLEHLGITSAADKLEMARKCGSSAQGDLLRMSCTYNFDKDETKKPAYIFLGTSCGDSPVVRSIPQDTEAAALFPILFRASREWNKIDQRFSHDLCIGREKLPPLQASTSDLQSFSLSWKKSPELGYRSWSKSLTQPAQVFGSIQVTVPFIQTQGRHLCTELEGTATDEIWEELFSL